MKIETKFNRGDKVWFMYKNEPTFKNILGINISDNEYDMLILYIFQINERGKVSVMEEFVFATKEELINSL